MPWQPQSGSILQNTASGAAFPPASSRQAGVLQNIASGAAFAPGAQAVPASFLDQARTTLQNGHDAFQAWLNRPDVSDFIDKSVKSSQDVEEMGGNLAKGAAAVAILGAPVPGASELGLGGVTAGGGLAAGGKAWDMFFSMLQSMRDGNAKSILNATPRVLKPDLPDEEDVNGPDQPVS
jgi:hypothetical protein